MPTDEQKREWDLIDALVAVNLLSPDRSYAEQGMAALRSGVPRAAVLAALASNAARSGRFTFESVLRVQMQRLEGELNEYNRCEAAQSGLAWRSGHTMTIERQA